MTFAQIFLIAAGLVALIAAYTDLKTGEIPNAVTLIPLAVAPIAHLAAGSKEAGIQAGMQAAGFSVLGAVACSLVPLLLYRAGAIGGGDVKLLAAIGALCRPSIGVEAEFYAFMAAALFAPARLAWEGKLMQVLGNTLALVVNPFLPASKKKVLSPEMLTSFRFGPAILAGVGAAAALHWKAP